MSAYFNQILMWVSLAMGATILLNRWFLSNNQHKAYQKWLAISREYFWFILIIFLLRGYFMEPFKIPSGSMRPGLQNGDYILVNKYTYGIRNPITNSVIVPINRPERGDPIVFFPPGIKQPFIKRVIGVAGDTVQLMSSGQTLVNGKPIAMQLLDSMLYQSSFGTIFVDIFNCQLVGKNYTIQLAQRDLDRDIIVGTYTVPKGHYFVMGDNRDFSADSRSCFGAEDCNNAFYEPNFPQPVGWSTVPEQRVIGKAVYRWMFWREWLSLPSFANAGKIH